MVSLAWEHLFFHESLKFSKQVLNVYHLTSTYGHPILFSFLPYAHQYAPLTFIQIWNAYLYLLTSLFRAPLSLLIVAYFSGLLPCVAKHVTEHLARSSLGSFSSVQQKDLLELILS